jgi:hypothetical protein
VSEYRGPERRKQPDYVRIDVSDVTPRTAPPYVMINFIQRNSQYVLPSDDGSMKLLLGRYGVNYYEDGPASNDGIYLRRWDVPPVRGPRGRWSRSDHIPSRTE